MPDCCSIRSDLASTSATRPCPVTGTPSARVAMRTVQSLVRRLPLGAPPAQYYFCGLKGCDVVYFPSDPRAPIFRRDDLLVRVGAKEESDPIPICYCFGIARRELLEEVQEVGKSATAERIKAEVKAGTCACEVKNPSGKCCLGEIARLLKEAKRPKVSTQEKA